MTGSTGVVIGDDDVTELCSSPMGRLLLWVVFYDRWACES
jgi:hypothetical protein